jgi:hypothetical protein
VTRFILLLCLCSCAGSFELARSTRSPVGVSASVTLDRQQCASLDSKRRWETIGAQGGAAIGGSTALAALFPDDPKAKAAVAITAGVILAVSGVVAKFADDDSTSWVKECGQ